MKLAKKEAKRKALEERERQRKLVAEMGSGSETGMDMSAGE